MNSTIPTNLSHIDLISAEMHLNPAQIKSVAQLLEDGATVPFIARYRKEATGSLDEVAVSAIRDRLGQLQELDSRREAILKSLAQHGHLTEDLQTQVQAAESMSRLEDLYLPYRPKRRTKATIAREKGLEPLALAILAQTGADPIELAGGYVDPEKTVDSVDAALSGARDRWWNCCGIWPPERGT
ncbi:Tex-like N-terminal domain-containing protein [Desulfosarcina sp.]|uniref:Tex-like N-terminal domain-containing protein n=1 Tax=Desulfosarcina sp. TaxID=2027861 RepID=UPI003569A105